MTENKRTLIFGGGAMNHIRPHFAVCAPAYGGTARQLLKRVPHAELVLTKMAGGILETNEEIGDCVDEMLEDPTVHVVYFNVALCDFEVSSMETGKDLSRLESRGDFKTLSFEPTKKLIEKIRKHRKDIFLVGFKVTTGATIETMYAKGLRLLKSASCNIVLVNDVHTKMNIIVVPEEAYYAATTDRQEALDELVRIVEARSQLHYIRTIVRSQVLTPWGKMPLEFRKVVEHCVKKGAYKAFQGKTSGHFAFHNWRHGLVYASQRKSNYNETLDMVRCTPGTDGTLDVHGGKASVGAQTQRIIFNHYSDVAYIVHFHCPLRDGREFPTVEQFAFECGSLECAANTLSGMVEIIPGIRAVMLDKHGPNIAFGENTDPERVIKFIDANFDLSAKTGGLIEEL